MPGAITGPHPGEEAGIWLARSATTTGTAQISGLLGAQYAGSADLRGAGSYKLVTFEVVGTPTASATLLAAVMANGYPSAAITSLVLTAAGFLTAILTAHYPYVVGRIDGLVAGATANLHLAAYQAAPR